MLLHVQTVLPMAKLQLGVQPLFPKVGDGLPPPGWGCCRQGHGAVGCPRTLPHWEDHSGTPRAAQAPGVKLLLCHVGIGDCAIPQYLRHTCGIASEPPHHAPRWGFLGDL